MPQAAADGVGVGRLVTNDYGHANLATSCAFVDELVARGLRHTVICPGSRSTPLAVALASHEGVKIWVLVDERSAGFFALGMARQLGEPVALLCTSGTAAANFFPAVVEASLSRIPLIVLTADRPPESRDWGAAQTIDQLRLFGGHAKWFVDMPVPDGSPELVRHSRAAAARAFLTAAANPPGPVHINLPFREPLLPLAGPRPIDLDELFLCERRKQPLDSIHLRPAQQDSSDVANLSEGISQTPRGIVVCGPGASTGLSAAVSAFSAATGFPVLADPLSGLRFGPHNRTGVIETYDGFLRDASIAQSISPEIIIRTGAVPTSKPLQQFLTTHSGVQHILIDPGAPRDPSHLATTQISAEPAETLECLARSVCHTGMKQDPKWLARWRAIDRRTGDSLRASLGAIEGFFEGRAITEVVDALSEQATLVIGNSMPIRDVDTFLRGDIRRLRLVANRGANGIDGVISSALGAAAVANDPVVLIIGDLSFYHDMNGLLAASRFDLTATIVVLNNDGGGIFSFLPQADQLDEPTFELLFGTPIGLSVSAAAGLYGATFARPETWSAFRTAIRGAIASSGLSIVEVVTDRQHNVALHRAVMGSVSESLSATLIAGA